jgi:hypothetical protein
VLCKLRDRLIDVTIGLSLQLGACGATAAQIVFSSLKKSFLSLLLCLALSSGVRNCVRGREQIDGVVQ